MSTDNNNIEVKITASTNSGGFSDAAKQIQNIGGVGEELISKFKGIGEAIGAAFAVDAIDGFARSMSELGEQIERATKTTGLSSDDIQKFQFAVKMTGGDAETATMSLMRLERQMADAAAGSKTAQANFAAAGVSMKTIASGDVNAVLGEIADKFSQTADGASKTALAMALAGRGGASLIPILDQGRAGLSSLSDQLDQTNSKLTEAQVQGFAKTAQEIKTMDAATVGVSEQIMTRLNPGIDGAVTGLTLMKEQFSESIKEGGAFAQIVEGLGQALMTIVFTVDLIKTGFSGLWDVVAGVFNAMVDKAKGTAQAISDIFHGDLTKAVVDYEAASDKAMEDIKNGFIEATKEGDKLIEVYNKMEAAANKGIIPGGDKAAGKDNRPQIQTPDQSGKNDTGDDEATQRSLYAQQYDVKKEYDDLMVESGKMTHKEEFADLQSSLSQTQVLVDQSFNDQAAQYDKDSIEYQKVMDQKSIADEKFQIEHMRLTQKATADDEKQWTDAINVIDSTFNRMVTGIFQGTQTIAQAFARMAGNMIISFAQAVGQILIKNGALVIAQQLGFTQIASALAKNLGEWVLTENTKTAATTGGDAERVSTSTAAAAEITASTIASSRTQIAAYAGVGAAAAFSSVAAIPFIGWAMAPEVGDEALTQGLSYEAFDIGTPNVPKTGLAMIHEGEAVVPKGEAKAWRDGDLSIGGGGTHFHINAMDSKDVKRFFNQHGATIAKAVSGSVRGGNRSFVQHVGG